MEQQRPQDRDGLRDDSRRARAEPPRDRPAEVREPGHHERIIDCTASPRGQARAEVSAGRQAARRGAA